MISDIYCVYILLAGDVGPPPSTVINQNETFAKVIFKPTVVQQAKIAQNGILGDFIIRYDVKREQTIGDIQVMTSMIPLYAKHDPFCSIQNYGFQYLPKGERYVWFSVKLFKPKNMSSKKLVMLPCWLPRVPISCFSNLDSK